jgi:hypothetical protein
MQTIYKYELPFRTAGKQTIPIPRGFNILHVGLQGGKLYAWAEITCDEPKVDFHYEVVGTGWELELGPRKHLTTFHDGPFVWHVYQLFQ